MQNFISASTVRDITSLRHDFTSALNQIGFIGTNQAELARYSVNSNQDNLVKAVLVGGLYPRVARIAMPKALFERVQQGAVQKDVRLSLVLPCVIHRLKSPPSPTPLSHLYVIYRYAC